MRILFVTSTLKHGGMERVITRLAGWFAELGDDTVLAAFDDGAGAPAYPVSPRVALELIPVNPAPHGIVEKSGKMAGRIRDLRRLLRRRSPDLVVSFGEFTNVLVALASTGLGIPRVVSERVHPAHHRIEAHWRLLRRLTYPLASAVVVQSESIRDAFPASLRGKIEIVPNPAPEERAPAGARAGSRVAAMGRLARQKGFDLLIPAFARAVRDGGGREWMLDIWGEGPERPALERLVAEQGMTGRIALRGLTTNPLDELASADIFVLSSRYEGMPNALAEAMCAGCAVVAFDCPGGVRELVRPGEDGVLVPPGNIEKLSEALAALMSDGARRTALGRKATEVRERFSMDRIGATWRTICERAISRGRS